ncbi:Leucine-rich repeat-containing protein 40 [Hondaea fermentalgiana]|uniref:Leucine-rich repeat-containing protein 40 n=1 Tax=Hondaea fermentalgiana TaxID=2315210 RepID=A0A2R5FYW1_9STRA|nr:Leucine-rich repeat-containing protein 40 [Hondaea fermentalgiana]|eukprot:GBG23946.1 Leucine-rich repeat-containing protein 40 [Hondaea fermentalgiana]
MIEQDTRKIKEILQDEEDERRDVFLARRSAEFPMGSIRSVLCRAQSVDAMANLVNLSLYGNNLVSLGGIEALKRCESLRSIDIGNNKLTSLSEGFAELTSLEELVADDNAFVEVPSELASLRNLEVLRLSGNRIERFAEACEAHGCWPKLRELSLDNNELTALPSMIGTLGALETLVLRGNKLQSLPEELASLQSLTSLSLSSNQLKTFLPGPLVPQLKALEVLLLNGNELSEIPAELAELAPCRVNLANNRLETIPQGLKESLSDLNVFGQKKVKSKTKN